MVPTVDRGLFPEDFCEIEIDGLRPRTRRRKLKLGLRGFLGRDRFHSSAVELHFFAARANRDRLGGRLDRLGRFARLDRDLLRRALHPSFEFPEIPHDHFDLLNFLEPKNLSELPANRAVADEADAPVNVAASPVIEPTSEPDSEPTATEALETATNEPIIWMTVTKRTTLGGFDPVSKLADTASRAST